MIIVLHSFIPSVWLLLHSLILNIQPSSFSFLIILNLKIHYYSQSIQYQFNINQFMKRFLSILITSNFYLLYNIKIHPNWFHLMWSPISIKSSLILIPIFNLNYLIIIISKHLSSCSFYTRIIMCFCNS